MEAFAKVLEAATHFIGVIAWPVAIVYLTMRFRPVIRALLGNIGEGTIKGFGMEASAKRKSEAVANLAAAQVSSIGKPSQVKSDPSIPTSDRMSETVEKSEKLITSAVLKQASSKNILWVDDSPDENIYESKAFRALGFKISKAIDTDAAIKFLDDENKIDIIISDMTRPNDVHAGITLLEKIRSAGRNTPFIIYTGMDDAKMKQKAKLQGATGYTSDPGRLIELVLRSSKFTRHFE